MYTGLKLQIVTDVEGAIINMERGLHTAPSNHYLINCALNEIFKNLN